MVLLKQNSRAPSFSRTAESPIASVTTAEEKRSLEKKEKKNWWVSRERNAGMATGAVCDWSIAGFSKPFFSHRHVQRVDKRHHPTDSLINCEMRCYLLLSYSGAPRTTTPHPPASPAPQPQLFLSVKRRKTSRTPSGFLKKHQMHQRNAQRVNFPSRVVYPASFRNAPMQSSDAVIYFCDTKLFLPPLFALNLG